MERRERLRKEAEYQRDLAMQENAKRKNQQDMAAFLQQQHDHKLVMGEIENKLVTTNEYTLNKDVMQLSNMIERTERKQARSYRR